MATIDTVMKKGDAHGIVSQDAERGSLVAHVGQMKKVADDRNCTLAETPPGLQILN